MNKQNQQSIVITNKHNPIQKIVLLPNNIPINGKLAKNIVNSRAEIDIILPLLQ